MRLVLGCWDIAGAGGSQSYLLTVAGQLQELGHDVTVHTALKGGAADVVGLMLAMRDRNRPGPSPAVRSSPR